jgi:hypothetical protein
MTVRATRFVITALMLFSAVPASAQEAADNYHPRHQVHLAVPRGAPTCSRAASPTGCRPLSGKA